MSEAAINKIQTEMKQNNNNPYTQVVGTFLTEHIKSHPEAAEKILNPEKTVGKSLDDMRKAAEKKKVGNCAVLTDQEGFGIVLKYFGIEGTVAVKSPEVKVNNTQKEIKPAVEFNISLDELLI